MNIYDDEIREPVRPDRRREELLQKPLSGEPDKAPKPASGRIVVETLRKVRGLYHPSVAALL